MEVQTVVENSLPIARLLKYIGIFPCAIVLSPKPFELTTSVSPEKYPSFQVDRSWASFLLRTTVQTYFGMRLAFSYIQLLRTLVFSLHYNFHTVASAVAGNLISTCAFGITLVTNQKQSQLALLLNQWQQTEMEIGSLILKTMSNFLLVYLGKVSIISLYLTCRFKRRTQRVWPLWIRVCPEQSDRFYHLVHYDGHGKLNQQSTLHAFLILAGRRIGGVLLV